LKSSQTHSQTDGFFGVVINGKNKELLLKRRRIITVLDQEKLDNIKRN